MFRETINTLRLAQNLCSTHTLSFSSPKKLLMKTHLPSLAEGKENLPVTSESLIEQMDIYQNRENGNKIY